LKTRSRKKRPEQHPEKKQPSHPEPLWYEESEGVFLMAKKQSFLKQFVILARYLKENKNALKTRRLIEKIRTTLTLANMEIAKMKKSDPLFVQRVKEFNEAIILLTQGKWYTTMAMSKNSASDWDKAFEKFQESKTYSDNLFECLKDGKTDKLPLNNTERQMPNTEINYAGDAPVIPEINPIVILQGSDFDMGYQYAQQLTEIFGKWILELKAGKAFTDKDRQVLAKWEEQLSIYAPELLPFCRGWAAGATDAGVPMAYEDVLDIWTGHHEPVTSVMGLADSLPKTAAPLCSGIAAWGRATVDGKLVTGSSGDHDASFMVTIMAFPETGNSFIITPFGATGDVAKLGPMFMTGHPGMNSKGVAYVEHGGEPRYVEPREHWGYGIRKGAAVFHILRFANSAREAHRMELSMPVGDIGTNFGSVGGFFADSEYGYILESRKEPVITRESGTMGETDFLYVNNSALHPDIRQAEWLKSDVGNWEWDRHGGWHPKEFTMVKKLGGVSEIVKSVMRTGYENSFHRNRFLFESLNAGVGRIDQNYIRDIYRTSGTIPNGDWSKITKDYNRTGKWGRITVGHASNALVTLMKPRADGTGTYSLCVGSAARGLAPMGPTFCTPIHNETNTFWELNLANDPKSSANKAQAQAKKDLWAAQKCTVSADDKNDLKTYAGTILSAAEEELNLADAMMIAAEERKDKVFILAKAVRLYLRCQVHARQAAELMEGIPRRVL
jgi:hypothetical protein